VNTILKTLSVILFYRADIVEVAHELRKVLVDYIDCVIVATAAALRKDLVTEDRDIHSRREGLERSYGIKILSYRDSSSASSKELSLLTEFIHRRSRCYLEGLWIV